MTWPIIAAGVIGLVTGAALATWWHRTGPQRRRQVLQLLDEICEGLD